MAVSTVNKTKDKSASSARHVTMVLTHVMHWLPAFQITTTRVTIVSALTASTATATSQSWKLYICKQYSDFRQFPLEIWIFDQNFDFLTKIWTFDKIIIFEIVDFCPKSSIFAKMFDFFVFSPSFGC